MPEPLKIKLRKALTAVRNPITGRNIIADGAVQGLSVSQDGKVRFALELATGEKKQVEALLSAAKSAANAVEGVTAVSAVATAPAPPSSGGHANPLGMQKKPRIEEAAHALSEVKHVIAIASGKGGVGKSTLTANLAVSMARQGLKVGLLDADIYGPSVPTLFGLKDKAAVRDGKIIPFEAHGVRAMSIGFIVDPDKALAWRGPMVMGALRQLMSEVEWGALDILLIDTPPGTGDAHLSLIQSKCLTGAVIVSTPQEMALSDMRRGITLFQQTKTPVIGIVENMAWLATADGARQYLFGEGGAEREAKALDVPFLGAVPLVPALREASDAGQPFSATDHPDADVFSDIAKKILSSIQ